VDFHQVAESDDYIVYEDMATLDTKETVTDDGVTLPAPKKYGPAKQDISPETLKAALKEFDGYEVDSVTLSRNGLTVRVVRPDDMTFEAEPDVKRLQARKGAKK
jgi:hypothetical protein